MKNLQWSCMQFSQLSKHQLYELLRLRVDVFVVEQECSYPELDNKDTLIETRHVCAHHDSNLIAYARLLAPGINHSDACIGRLLVDASQRHQGIGSELLQTCLKESIQIWPDHNIRLSAQKHLKEFYATFGFSQVTKPYLEDGIPHITMLLDKEKIDL